MKSVMAASDRLWEHPTLGRVGADGIVIGSDSGPGDSDHDGIGFDQGAVRFEHTPGSIDNVLDDFDRRLEKYDHILARVPQSRFP